MNNSKINIRPGVSMLSVLKHLNYKPWFAIAEFVDNSLQSYLEHEEALKKLHGDAFKLKVTIELNDLDGGSLTIRDNAGGIKESDYQRAFRPAQIPLDRSGLSEFGMGMKSAACWFADSWNVRTSALGEPAQGSISFDIKKILDEHIEDLTVELSSAPEEAHFTEVVLKQLHRFPQGRTQAKIKEHLASIYRVYIREGKLELYFDNEPLTYIAVPILTAAPYKTPLGQPIQWCREIEFDLGNDMRVHGFAALRERGNAAAAGFALFRRKRLIEGSADEGYRPASIFGKSNTFTYQRLFGELHLDGFEVSHTKDGFRWDENEEPFLELLKEELNKDPLPLLTQAEQYRAKRKLEEFKANAETAMSSTAQILQNEMAPLIEKQLSAPAAVIAPALEFKNVLPVATFREIELTINDIQWQIRIELTLDPAIGEWLDIVDRPTGIAKNGTKKLGIRMSISHPFMERFGGPESDSLEPILRLAVGLSIAETTARDSGVPQAGAIRRNLNDLLLKLSNP